MSECDRAIPADVQSKQAEYNSCLGSAAPCAQAQTGPSVWHTIVSLRRIGARFAGGTDEHQVIKTAEAALANLFQQHAEAQGDAYRLEHVVADVQRRIEMARFALTALDPR